MSTETTKPEGESGEHTGDAAYWQAEAKKAFDQRQRVKAEADELRKKLDALNGIDPEEYRSLKKTQAQLEEERAKKAGEFDKLQEQLIRRHKQELDAVEQRAKEANDKWRSMLVSRAFAEAVDLFGPTGRTIYLAADAERIFGDRVELADDGSILVRDSSGEVIVDRKTGKPAAFASAMAAYIEALPDKHYRLRGSERTGSGSSGGTTKPVSPTDVDALIERVRKGDPEARKQLAAIQAAKAGGIQFGRR